MNKFQAFLVQPDNQFCADCGAPNPKWASTNTGVIICDKCYAIHRSMGALVSKLIALNSDDWTGEEIALMLFIGGNSGANAAYEAFLPTTWKRPMPDSSTQERAKFIRCTPRVPSLNTPVGAFPEKAQTRVVRSSLNPTWDEQHVLSVPHASVPLKLRVFDRDTFSEDDTMGDAVVDLQPLYAAVRVQEAMGEELGNVQVGKWAASRDNDLVCDSIIWLRSGRLRQDVKIRLRNVESGELDLEIEWVPFIH